MADDQEKSHKKTTDPNAERIVFAELSREELLQLLAIFDEEIKGPPDAA